MSKQEEKTQTSAKGLRSALYIALSVVVMAVVAWIMFYPSDVNGDVLQQHDIMQGVANGQEGVLHEQ